jgi:hypothetical protein
MNLISTSSESGQLSVETSSPIHGESGQLSVESTSMIHADSSQCYSPLKSGWDTMILPNLSSIQTYTELTI